MKFFLCEADVCRHPNTNILCKNNSHNITIAKVDNINGYKVPNNNIVAGKDYIANYLYHYKQLNSYWGDTKAPYIPEYYSFEIFTNKFHDFFK